MVFVFGIDIPLLEILLVVSILILIAVIFLVWAQKRISNSLQRLERDLERFESVFVKKEKRIERSLEQLRGWVKNKLSLGEQPEKLKRQLKKLGWREELIERAFKE